MTRETIIMIFLFNRSPQLNIDAGLTLKNVQLQGRTSDLGRGVLLRTLRLKSEVLTPQMGVFQRQPFLEAISTYLILSA